MLIGKIPMQAGSSLTLALALGLLYWLVPDWNPLQNAFATQAARWTLVLACIGCGYLLMQSLQYLVGRVGSAANYIVDLGVSAIPLFVLIVIWSLHYSGGGATMSPWVQIIMMMASLFVVLDLLILGSVGALVNRLTDELHRQS